ncbi:MAG: hypothetical protein Q9209_005386 [Squamulea sp. 1 TL-2023]
MSYPSSLKVGVLLCGPVQLMDVAPVDMLGMLDKKYVEIAHLPEQIASKALDIEFYFINETGEGPHPMTAGFKIAVTVCTLPNEIAPLSEGLAEHSISTCPPLDILLIGGPPPTYRPSPAIQSFIKTQYAHVRALLTVCTGHIPALYSGVLNNKTATAPQGLLPMLKEEMPEVKWVEKRWVRDGKVWSSGAVANGLELMGAFMREEFKEIGELVEAMLGMADFGVRGEDY